MAALGFTVNLMTLFALILAIGIVVDDAIIIVENSSYYIEQGMPPKEATIKAMQELTGPVMGITLALVAVFLPAAFLPGITGQIFRQFALVIAATAVISALNALTLKPVQCALWLKPRGEKPPNWFYRGFNRAFGAVTDVYMGIVRRMVKRPVLMLMVFIVIVSVTVWGFLRRPTGFLPTEDQGYAILVSVLPEGASQPRSRRGRGKNQCHPPENRRDRGLGDHRGLLGPGLRQRPQYLHDLHRLQGLEGTGRRPEPGQDHLRPQPRSGRDPGSTGLCRHPAADPGSWPDGRLPDDGGGPRKPRPDRAPARHVRARPEGQFPPEPAGSGHHLQRPQPPGLPEHRPDQGGVPAGSSVERLRHAPGLPGLLVRQPVQQVQPGVPGLYPGRQRLPSASPGT